MVLTLWFSSKAKKVVKTSLDLSDQNDIKERFKPNLLSRSLVRFFIWMNQYFSNLVPISVNEKINNSFSLSNNEGLLKIQTLHLLIPFEHQSTLQLLQFLFLLQLL